MCVVFLLLVGRWFQSRQQRWAGEAVGLLQQFTPASCRVVHGDTTVEISIEALAEGDQVEVLSGGVVPADGLVTQGESALNRSLLTGESQAEPVGPGDAVHAGEQNIGCPLRFTVQAVGGGTRVGRLMRLVELGVEEKSPLVQLADRASGWFVVVVILAAATTFAGWSLTASIGTALDHTIALLIVACPCALGLATPLTLAVAIGRAARQSVLIKNGAALEILARRGEMLLDKNRHHDPWPAGGRRLAW